MSRCCYCGREDNEETNFHIRECPVCKGLVCPVCSAIVSFFEQVESVGELEQFLMYKGEVCLAHIPWTIIEGIKKSYDKEEK